MKVLLISILACSLTAAQTFAQSAASPAAAAAQTQPAQSPELEEAARLSSQVGQLYAAGKFDEALSLATRVLAIREKLLGPSAVPVADALADLGAVQRAVGKSERAREAYERAVAIYEAALGPEAAETADARNSLGWLYYWTRSYAKAEPAFRRALAARERLHGATHPHVADTLSGLAAVHLATGDAAKRDESFLRLIDAVENVPGPMPKGYVRLLLAYRCIAGREDLATEPQREILNRISELWKKRAAREGTPADGEVLNGRAISKPAPPYPAEAKHQRVSGTVVVHITVDETGRVVEAEAICGPPLLYDASVQAARKARFTPTLIGTRPVKVSGTITYNFNLM